MPTEIEQHLRDSIRRMDRNHAALMLEHDTLRAALEQIRDHNPDECSHAWMSDCFETVREIARAALEKDV